MSHLLSGSLVNASLSLAPALRYNDLFTFFVLFSILRVNLFYFFSTLCARKFWAEIWPSTAASVSIFALTTLNLECMLTTLNSPLQRATSTSAAWKPAHAAKKAALTFVCASSLAAATSPLCRHPVCMWWRSTISHPTLVTTASSASTTACRSWHVSVISWRYLFRSWETWPSKCP